MKETKRRLTQMELDLITAVFGMKVMWMLPNHDVYLTDDRARVEFDTCDVPGTLKVFLPEDVGAGPFIHEMGHVVHLLLWPESAKWSEYKCEVFAMLGVVRLGLHTLGYLSQPETASAGNILAKARNMAEAMTMAAENRV